MAEKLEASAREFFVRKGYEALRSHEFGAGGPEIHIGVIGPYQAGKSTFINTLFGARYPVAFTGNPEDDHREGVTQKIHVYDFKDRLFLYDTPGFWDPSLENQTRVFLGLEQNLDYVPFDRYALCKTGEEICPVADRTLKKRGATLGENVKWAAETVIEGEGLADLRDRRKYGKLGHVRTGNIEDRQGVVLPVSQCRSLSPKGDAYVPGGVPCPRLEEAAARPNLTMLFVVVDVGDRVSTQQISSAKAIARNLKERFGAPTIFLLNRGLQWRRLSEAERARAEERCVATMRGEFPAYVLSALPATEGASLDADHEEVIALIAELAFADEGRKFRRDLRRRFHFDRALELDREIVARSIQAASLPRKKSSAFVAHLIESASLILARATVPFTPPAEQAGPIESVLRGCGLFAPGEALDIWAHVGEPGKKKGSYGYADLWPRQMLESAGSFERVGRALKPQAGFPGFLANFAFGIWVYNQMVRAERDAEY
ncbi:MAG: 50S ribosome-binding GTPase, partial [Candidatus Methylomirabilis sp.]|nr:50S ribosome-binding GTPase [Deltaproteobacteria bacterium]